MELHLFHIVDEDLVHAFQADGTRLQNLWNMLCRLVDIPITKHQQAALFGPVHQPDLCPQGDDASALGTNQRARYMEAIFRQQLIQAVSGDSAGNFRIATADQISILIAQAAESGIDLTLTAAGANHRGQLSLRSWSYAQAQAV